MQERTFIALDLELNQPSNKIIQVGVSIGNPGQTQNEFVTKQWLLDPEEPISDFIIKLTGITDADIQAKAVSWPALVTELSSLIDEHKPFTNPVTWGGGDALELLAEIRARQLEFPYFGHRWIDIKTYHVFCSLATGKNPTGGLRSIMARYGLTFKGLAHRADVDASNTLELFFNMMHRQGTLEAILKLAKNSKC